MKEGVKPVVGRRALVLNKMAREGWKGLVRGFSTAQSQPPQPSSRTENSVRMETRVVGIMELVDSGCVLQFSLLRFPVRRT